MNLRGTRSSPSVSPPLSRSLRMYERIAIGFVVLTALLLLSVLYLSVARATIRVSVRPEEITAKAFADVAAAPGDKVLPGKVVEGELTRSRVFTLPGEGATPVPEKASGYLTIKNETGSPQPLVATTRFLSSAGVLFRLEAGTTVPARGEVQALVKADQPGQAGEIGPDRFTIPGLNESQQKVIYAVSTEPMKGGVQYVRTLTEEDVSSAAAELTEAIRTEAIATAEQGVDRKAFDGMAWSATETARSTNVAVGEAAGSFELTLTVKVTTVFYSTAAIRERAAALLTAQVPQGQVLHSVAESGEEVEVAAADAKAQTARLSIGVHGTAVFDERAEALDPARFLGRSEQEVKTLLSHTDAVIETSVSFTPFWLKRVPTLRDHVDVVIVPEEK